MAVGVVEALGVSESILHNFAKRLANNEPKQRRIALKKLRLWLKTKSNSFVENDLLKIWKGLHYCYWMADKPVLQEELAECMASLLQCFDTFSTSLLFTKAFFVTQAREWSGTDQLRIDKFMMLIRRVLRHSLTVLRQRGWLRDEVVSFANTLDMAAIDGLNSNIPDGLRYFLIDIYLNELHKVGGSELSRDLVYEFILPFCQLTTKSCNKVLVSYTAKTLWASLLKGDLLQIDCTKLGDHMFKLAAKRSCRNRSIIYKLVNRCREAIKCTNGDVEMDLANDITDQNHLPSMLPVETSGVQEAEQPYSLDNQHELVSNKKKRKAEKQDLNLVAHSKKKAKRLKLEACDSDSAAGAGTKITVPEKQLLDEEIEIWIPNRKYTGPLAQKFAEKKLNVKKESEIIGKSKAEKSKKCRSVGSEEKPFLTFEKSDKVPAALVRKGFKTPKTEPRLKISKKTDPQKAMSTGQRKRVKFAKNLTQSQNFEDSLNITPKPAFDPRIQPDRAILKTSASKTANVLSRTPKKQLFRSKPTPFSFS